MTTNKQAVAQAIESMERSCAQCRFHHMERLPPPNLGEQMTCRHGPKQVTLIPMQQGLAVLAQFPPVMPADWCFQFQVIELPGSDDKRLTLTAESGGN